MTTFDEVMAQVAPATDVVSLCLAGNVRGKIAELEAAFARAEPPTSLGERSQASVIAEQIAVAQQRMRDSSVDFHLESMHPTKWASLQATRTAKRDDETKDEFNERWFAWTCDLVSKTLVNPVMTPEQVAEFVGALKHPASWDELSERCWSLNSGKVSVPFSAAVSALIPNSVPTSKPRSGSGSATANGAGPKRRPRRATSTKATGSSAV